jgi:hypothetical protein
VYPPDHREKFPPGANRQLDLEGDSSSWQVGVKASDTQQNLLRCRNQHGSTAHQIGKNPVSNLGLPQDTEGKIDHLPETTSNRFLKPCLSGSGSKVEVLFYAKVCKTPPRVNRGLSFSQEIVTTEVKGWITKNSVPKGGDSQKNRCIIHHYTG